jgi:hypothetical protein
MRKVILAAALAVTFAVPLRSHAQQGGGGASAGGAAAGTTAGGATAGGSGGVGAASGDPQVELARLRSEVDQLRAELDGLKAERGQGGKGTGGSGASAGSRAQLLAASATFEGRVRNVSEKSIEVIDRETGEPYLLQVDKGTRVRSGERRIPVASIREGCEVRASFNFVYGDTYATNIEVLPKGRR